jgi:hypothetical protein
MLKLIEEKQMCVDKLDANKSRESTGWAMVASWREQRSMRCREGR